MNPTSGSLLVWAFGVSILIHLGLIGIIKFENALVEVNNERLINIALPREQDLITPNQESLQSLPNKTNQNVVENKQTIPDTLVVPIAPDRIQLQKNPDQPSSFNNVDPLVKPPTQFQTIVPQMRAETQLRQPNKIEKLSNESTLSAPPLVQPQQLDRHTSQEQLLAETTTAKKPINLNSMTEDIPPVQRLADIPESPSPPNELARQSAPRQVTTTQTDPLESKLIEEPLIGIPPLSPAPPRAVTKIKNSDETVSPQPKEKSKTSLTAQSQYVKALHSTLNKRAQRNYPRKAIQNCIQGTVEVQIKISPNGDQLSYEIRNPEEVDPILQRAAAKLLDGKKDYLSFDEEVSNEAVIFQVSLIYSLPRCQ